jgi:hypothetical protein
VPALPHKKAAPKDGLFVYKNLGLVLDRLVDSPLSVVVVTASSSPS